VGAGKAGISRWEGIEKVAQDFNRDLSTSLAMVTEDVPAVGSAFSSDLAGGLGEARAGNRFDHRWQGWWTYLGRRFVVVAVHAEWSNAGGLGLTLGGNQDLNEPPRSA
jgi:hypothetical protein